MKNDTNKGSFRLLGILVSAYPLKSAIVLICLLFAGLAEGIGIASLLPLLSMAIEGEISGENVVTRTIGQALSIFGVEPSFGMLLALIAITMTIKSGLVLLAAKTVGYVSAHVSTDLRVSLIRALLGASWPYFINQQTGSLTNALATATRCCCPPESC